MHSGSFDKIKIQLRVLKLISIKSGDEWILNPHGDNYITKLLTIHTV
jgi:uncharacterized protein with PhoU and TrkA domain